MHINPLEQVYKQHYKALVKRALVITGDIEKAEDVLHDVFLKLLDQPKKQREISDLKAYLFQSVTNGALNHWKSNQKLVILDDSHDTLEQDTPSDKKFIEEQEDLDHLKKKLELCLSKLAPRQQLIFKLSRYEGLDHDEIAAHLDISKSTVKNQIVTVLNYLRGRIP